ncbi:hypothetical protein CLAFUW4_05381 [Fulvia fulva]|uniref:NAD(P)-binding protein n=1 Tax=Passalora fulva TaxID=5499 RepID=A0A9Q8LH64_PASFU|nr:uncharacterized protein CLAFUR5_05529 [Fulvia fulva]KAK4624673.1 hypothetical protein CLAFUR4_05375 [Fulvia fulva]KAK4625875.1 hypothetical protein CLAFUR0_05383 [Fulvia fulva]UJO17351.1 hypothetical protein CLAFUR5_05529 [Fulvia fulva]WPV15624.1 hypothetical protein CLAFUW4_05381 [Fulvia fulva]WPV29507.1 hypothetical protein CLAFUW7_05379 [Fulvia fulva]
MPLTVLGNQDVTRILHSLNKDDILEVQQSLADALHWYSTSADENDFCSDFQPERTQLKRKDGSTTLFMPASGLYGQGVKVLNITSPDDARGLPALAENMSLSSDGDSKSFISSTRRQDSMASTNTNSPNSSLHATTSPESDRSLKAPLQSENSAVATVKGTLTLLDNEGNTTGLIDAEELTAFRAALASTMLLKKRHSVHDLTVFGAGRQAYWHIRLALLLRGPEIHHLNIVTRNFESARQCIMRIYNPQLDDPNFVDHIGQRYNSKTKVNLLTPMHTEYQRLLKEYVRASNIIFCCTPSTSPLFPATYLTNPEGRKKGRYIACIGSFKPHMVELHPDILKYAVAPHHEQKHIHKRQKEGGAILVDTVTGCLKEAGEVVQAKLTPDQAVELGELLMLKKDAEQRSHSKGEKSEEGCHLQDNSGLKEWLTRGDVIYKSVGLGLMDVVVGNELLGLAWSRGIGTRIENF